MLEHSGIWFWHAEKVATVLKSRVLCGGGGGEDHASIPPIFICMPYIVNIHLACMWIRVSRVIAWVESNPDRVECASEPECDEVSWSVSLGCLAGSERNVSPAGKAALLTSELSRLALRTYLFTFHREKGWCRVVWWTWADAILVKLC